MKHNVSQVVIDGLCTGCGVCIGACARKCISFEYGKERNNPIIDEDFCIDCGLCYDVCPGKGIQLNNLSDMYFSNEPGIQQNLCSGYYRHGYVGYSNNYDTRMHCATGGMVTQFLIWLLEKKEIDGAVVVRYKKDNPLVPEPFIAVTKEEIWESRSSKYVVLSMDKVAHEIAFGNYKNLVVVGLPCQIQGWRQLAKRNKRVREAIKGYFAIYCSINKTKLSMDYYPQRYQMDIANIGRFAFRDDGCLGYMKFEDKQGNVMKKIPYKSFWYGTHSFFTNPRCLMCIDQLGELADISFGDIHIKPYSDDEIGINSIISRSAYWDEMLNQCKMENAISLDIITIETVIKSQLYAKKYKKGSGAKAYMNIRRMLGKSIPAYDYQYKGSVSIKDYLSAISKMLMYTIGKRRFFWWLIKILDRTK